MNQSERQTYFDTELVARKLREVSIDQVNFEKFKIKSYWYHAAHMADVMLWYNEHHELIKNQVTIYGQIIEWNAVDGVRTGVVIEEEIKGLKNVVNETVQFDRTPNIQAVEQACVLIKNMPMLSSAQKQKITLPLTPADDIKPRARGLFAHLADFFKRFAL